MRIKIRTLVESDAYTSYRWRNDPEVFKYTGNTYQHEITLNTELDWIRRVIANVNDFRCAIIVDDIYVGNVYLTNISEGKAWFHIFIGDRMFWGKGVAKRASQLMFEYARTNLKLNTIQLSAHVNNISAIKLYKSLGFENIGSKDGRRIMCLNL